MHLGNDSFSRIASSASIRSDVTHIICPSSHGNNVFAGPGQGSSAVPPPSPRRKRPSSPGEYCFRQSVVRFRPAWTPGRSDTRTHTHPHPHTHTSALLYACIAPGRFAYLFIARARTPRPIFITSRRKAGRRVISPIFAAVTKTHYPLADLPTDNRYYYNIIYQTNPRASNPAK